MPRVDPTMKVPSLYRQPEDCLKCGFRHMPTEPCDARVRAMCVNCGGLAGLFHIDAATDRECIGCIRERLR